VHLEAITVELLDPRLEQRVLLPAKGPDVKLDEELR
jgi:hypothetical protein